MQLNPYMYILTSSSSCGQISTSTPSVHKVDRFRLNNNLPTTAVPSTARKTRKRGRGCHRQVVNKTSSVVAGHICEYLLGID